MKIGEFLERVKREFDPDRIILFGDNNILVVSRKFEGMSSLERLYLLHELWDYDFHAEIYAYTPEEFEVKKKEIGIVKQAVKEGIEV
ncbi:MAG: nucleotidyltransferase domain-containing protein [Candidatus Hydrothermarchaeota archaeon]